MNTSKLVSSIAFASVAFGAVGCLQQSNLSSSSTLSAINSNNGISGTTSTPAAVSFSAVTKVPMNLGTTSTFPVTISSANGYSGMVNLSLDNKVLAANDPMSMITTSVSPASVSVAPGPPAAPTVTVTAAVGAPDLDSFVNVVASAGASTVSGQVPVNVVPTFEVDVEATGPAAVEKWSTDALGTIKFTQHTAGVTLIFKNKDATTPSTKNTAHRVHSSRTAFHHEGNDATDVAGSGTGEGMGLPGTTTPLTIDAPLTNDFPGQTAGDTYTAIVKSQVAGISDTYYCHTHEDPTTAGRTMIFNAYSAPAKIGNSGNPNASYAYLQKNVFTPSCASCHNPAQKSPVAGGVDLSTYAAVSASSNVLPGSAASSALYIAVNGGGMPQGGTPLTSVQLQAVMDWINDGAKNN